MRAHFSHKQKRAGGPAAERPASIHWAGQLHIISKDIPTQLFFLAINVQNGIKIASIRFQEVS